jgi:hypothetical protein
MMYQVLTALQRQTAVAHADTNNLQYEMKTQLPRPLQDVTTVMQQLEPLKDLQTGLFHVGLIRVHSD